MLKQDFRYALRSLAKHRGFSIVAIVTLAIGIGANSAIFGLVDAVMLRPLPHIEQPERLVWVSTVTENGRLQPVSYADFIDYRDQGGVFADAMAFTLMPVNLLIDGGEPERLKGQLVTGGYFSVLGARPALGRTFAPEEDRTPGSHPVVVISHALWTRRFAADPAAVGTSIVVNGHRYTVIGVAAKDFVGAAVGEEPDVWLPAMMHAEAMPRPAGLLTERNASTFQMIGRLKPGVSAGEADAAVRTIAARIAKEHPRTRKDFSAVASAMTGGLRPSNNGEALPIAALGLGVTAVVLLIACANVANLLLGRAASRRREIGIRLALGASRGRLVRQLLTESLVLAFVAGVLGTLLAAWSLELLVKYLELPFLLDLSLDARTLGWTAAICALTAVAFGLVPALSATRPALVPALREDALSGGSGRRSRTQGAFVVGQMALSLMLLGCAGLLLRSLRRANTVDVGIPTKDQLVALSLDIGAQGYSPEKSAAFYRELVRRAQELPGVRSASLASLVPLGGTMVGGGLQIEGQGEAGMTFESDIWPGYFSTLGIPLLSGRDFTLDDRAGAPGVVIINETLARRYWGNASPIGKRIKMSDGEDTPYLEIVAVAKDAKYDDLTERPRPMAYLPRQQRTSFRSDVTLLVRAEREPEALIPSLKATVRAMEPALALFDVQTMRQYIEQRIDKERATTRLLSLFGLISLGLAAVGMYGVVAYVVSMRTREFGVRIALGARSADVLSLVLGEGARLAMIGVGVGLVLTLAAAQLIRGLLIDVGAADVIAFIGAAALLSASSMLASYIPARRATRVDPAVALRNE